MGRWSWKSSGLLAFALILLAAAGVNASGPFDTLLGAWGGTGSFKLEGGQTERIRCNAYYSGGGAQLGMVVRCAGQSNNIEIRSKLSYSGNRLSGNWEERTFNAEGEVSGQISSNRLSLGITGAVSGSMNVSYSRSRQDVTIATQGIPLQSVNITLSRQ